MPSKYGNRITEVDGIKFRSKREARRYEQLKLLQRVGEIRSLKLQPRFPLKVNGILAATYVADFEYEEAAPDFAWTRVVEDAKGAKTLLYILKAKLFQALYGFPVREV